MLHNCYLDAIGISLLEMDHNQAIDAAKLRRVFPWLLRDVRTWFSDCSPSTKPSHRLTELSLTDFRVAGTRQWKLASTSLLHVLHGHNGSGKSSLAEAFELLVSGRVERLGLKTFDSAADAKLLTNRVARRRLPPAVANVSVTYEETVSGPSSSKWSLDETWQDTFKAEGRVWLDQKFSDRLIGVSPAERAICFLQAFFPNEVRPVEELRTALAPNSLAIKR